MHPASIIEFWFTAAKPQQWWAKDPQFDQLIAAKFRAIHAAAARSELYAWRDSAAGRLAEVIVLDQFSRNLYRDSPLAFAQDSLALALAQEAVAAGADRELTPEQRVFLYLPYMHSESLRMQDIAVELYRANGIASNLHFAQRHRDIIVRFGRFPHRNQVLGRPSTAAEREFLRQPGSAF